MNIEHYIELWDNRRVRLLDTGITGLNEGTAYREQPVPSNTFMLVQGHGRIWQNETMHTAAGWYVLHSGKGDCLRIEADSEMELHRIVYMLPDTEEGAKYGKDAPDTAALHCSFGLRPDYPLPLKEIVTALLEKWQETAILERFQVTSVFYQWLYELFKQMLQQTIDFSGPDRVNQAVRYMLEHCGEPLSIEHVAAVTGCSPRFLSTLFRKRFQASPGQILARLRLERASELLLNTEATLQEIGERVGYANAFTFSRFFKKHCGIAPEQYRREAKAEGNIQHSGEGGRYHAAAGLRAESGVSQRKPGTAGSRFLNTPIGEIKVPYKPQRVVVDWSLGEVLALGLTPLGAPHTLLDSNRLLGQYISVDIQDIGNHNSISLERVLELEPDLIITWNSKAYASYARIAPTVVYPSEGFRTAGEGITAMGHILNRSEQAAKWIAEYRRRSSRLRSMMLRQGRDRHTFTVVDPNWSDDIQVVGNSGTRGGRAAYGLLGLHPARRVWNELFLQQRDSIWISRQDIGSYAEDYMLVLQSDRKEAAGRRLNTPAVEQTGCCRWIELPWEHYFLSDPASALLQAEEITRLITAAD